MYHDNSLREYQEIHKMIEAIFWSYYFLHMWKKVQSHINKCDLCHRIKSARHKSYKEIRIVLTLD